MSVAQPPQHVVEYANPRAAGQPFNSRFVVERHDDGVSFKMLPDGLNRAAFALSLLGTLAIVILLAPALMELRLIPRPRTGVADFWLLAIITSAPCAMFWLLLLRAARRPTVISIRGGRVTLFSGAAVIGPVETWPVDDVESVRARGRCMTLVLRNGRQAVLIAGHDRADLEWVAKQLRSTLALPQ